METREIMILSLHPDPSQPLGLDLKHILSALDSQLSDWTWRIKNLDWLGENGESLCRPVEAAGAEGFWIDSPNLVRQAWGIHQTIEGEFVAFPQSIDRRYLGPSDLSLSTFPASQVTAAIVAVDGSYFDVYLKDSRLASRLQERFLDAVVEKADLYF